MANYRRLTPTADLAKGMPEDYVAAINENFNVIDLILRSLLNSGLSGNNIYGSVIRAGQSDSTLYSQMDSLGTIKIVYGGNTVFSINADGNMYFYLAGATTPIGQVGIINDTYPSFAFQSKTYACSLRSPTNVILIPGGSSYKTYSIGAMQVEGNLTVIGNISASGTKSNVEDTSQGKVKLYALEMPDNRYQDSGVGQIKNGRADIKLDPLLLEIIEPDSDETPWVIQITPYGHISQALYVDTINADSFRVGGSPWDNNIRFAWTLTAYRKGYSDVRFEKEDN